MTPTTESVTGPSTDLPATAGPGPETLVAAAWQRYHEAAAGLMREIEASEQFRTVPEQRPKAYHAMMESLAMAYNFAVGPRLRRPRIHHNTAWQTDMYTLGGNGPDFDYRTIFLDGKQSYRLTGNLHDSRLVLGQLSGGLPGSADEKAARNCDFSKFRIGAEGSFEIFISATPHEGNWIELDPAADYQWILFRPTVDTFDSRPAEFHIEQLTPEDETRRRAEEFDPAAIARRIDFATGFLRYMIRDWTLAFYPRTMRNAGGPNRLFRIGTEISGEVGSPTAEYVMGTYALADDECLLLELADEPQGVYWGVQVFDVWLRSIDFRNRQSSLNSHQIARDADGRIRLVVASSDPGIANWLDTDGFDKGQLLLRNYRTSRPSSVDCRVVKLADLGNHLPQTTQRISPAEREQTMERRRAAYLRRHGE